MKRIKVVLSIIVCMILVFVLVGCGINDDVEKQNFGNYNPEKPQVSYRDENAKIIDNINVSDEYYDTEATKKGTLQYEYYNTYDYDEDMHPMEKYVVVYTPYGYDPNKQYDIMYLTHGHTGAATTWLGYPTNPYEVKNVLDHLIEDGKVRPMIVVSMTYYDDNEEEETRDYDRMILDSFGQEIRNDIIPAVESKYSTYAVSTHPQGIKASRNHRIMGGFSMGGVVTWLQMCESMDYFKYYMPTSGSLYWTREAHDNRDGFNPADKLTEAIISQGYDRNDFYVYMSTGTDDFSEPTVSMQFERMKEHSDMFTFGQLGDEGVNCSFGIGQDEGHNRHGRGTALYNALPAISSLIGRE